MSVDFGRYTISPENMTMFLAYSARKSKQQSMTYQDKELFDLMLGFTRSKEEEYPKEFWQKNLSVMKSAVKLLKRVQEVLVLLFETCQITK